MALNSLNMAFVFTARDMASPQIVRINQSLQGLQGTAKRSAADTSGAFYQAAQMVSGVGHSMRRAVSSAVDVFANFDFALTQAGTIANASAEELELFKKASIEAGIATDWSPTQAAEALSNLSGMGLSAKEALDALTPSLQMASASLGQLKPEEAVTAMMAVTNAYGVKATKEMLTNLSGMSIQLSNISSVAPKELPNLMASTASSAKTAGQSMSELFTIVGASHDIGGSKYTGSAVNQFLAKLIDPKKQSDIQKAFGVDVVDKTTGKLRSGLEVAADMIEKASTFKGGLEGAEAGGALKKIFGLQGMRAVTGIAGTMSKGFKNAAGEILHGRAALIAMRSELENSGDAAKVFQEKMLNTVKGQRKLLAGSAETLLILIGENFAKATKPFVQFILDGLNSVIHLVQGMSEGTKEMLGKIVVYGAGIASAFGAVVSTMVGLKGIGLVLRGIGIEIVSVRRALLLFTGWGIALGAAAVVFGQLWTENIGGFRDAILDAWGHVKNFFQGLTQLLTTGKLSGDVMRNLLADPTTLGVLHTVWRLLYRIKMVAVGIWRGFSAGLEVARPVFEKFVGALGHLWTAFAKMIGISTKTGEAFSLIPSQEFLDWGFRVGSMLANILSGIVDVASWLIDKLAVAFEYIGEVIDFVRPYFEDFWAMLMDPNGAAQQNMLGIIDVVVGIKDAFLGAINTGVAWVTGMYDWATQSGGVVDQMTGWFTAFWGMMARGFNSIWEIAKGFFNGVVAAVEFSMPYWDKLWAGVVSLYDELVLLAGEVVSFASDVWNFVVPALTDLYNGFIAIYDFIAPVLIPVLQTLGSILGWIAANVIQAVILPALDWIIWGFRGIVFAIRVFVGVFRVAFGVIGVVLGAFITALKWIWGFFTSDLPNAFVAAWDFVKSVFSGVVSWFGRQIDEIIIKAANAIKVLPDWMRPAGAEFLISAGDEAQGRMNTYNQRQSEVEQMRDSGMFAPQDIRRAEAIAEEKGITMAYAMTKVEQEKQLEAKQKASLEGPSVTQAEMDAESVKANEEKLDALMAQLDKSSAKPLSVQSMLVVDGKVLAEAVNNATSEDQARSFDSRRMGSGFVSPSE